MRRTRARARRLAAALVVAGLAFGEQVVGDERAALAMLDHVRLAVDVAHPLSKLTAPELTPHLAEALRRAQPPLSVEDGASDRIRLVVAVRSTSATALRGFWLPFSGTYGIGTLRLDVERLVTLPGVVRAFPARVWGTQRDVAVRWEATDEAVTRLLDEMVLELLDARRRAHGLR
jgi:hypothetical protein